MKKRNTKLVWILSILVVLLFAAGAYILFFRTNVTVDYYVARGNKSLQTGRYQSAIQHFQTALKMDSENPNIPIGLAQAYKGDKNFTKAEYTLVRAISQNPEQTPLYIELSRTYLEQQKFKDADLLINNRVTSEAVKNELAAMRPAAPVLTPESGYYSDYISVSASCPAGRIYLTTDGEYPSNEEDLYSSPVQLAGGETTICAAVVDDSGLISPVTFATYTVTGVIEPVSITDPFLDTTIREAIGKPGDYALMSNDLWSIEALNITEGATDLSQLHYLAGLKQIRFENTSISDYSPIAELPNLKQLEFVNCSISSETFDKIAAMTELEHLTISGCAVRNVEFITNLIHLNYLDLSNNIITDITPLSGLSALKTLYLNANGITTLSPLVNCTELETLDVSVCNLTGIEEVANFTKLKTLNAADNAILSVSGIENCTALQTVNFSSNPIQDISVLADLPLLVSVDCSYNNISAIADFENDHPLQTINLNYNAVSSVSHLTGLSSLNYVFLDYNNVSDLTPLKNCYNLVQVNVWDNPVSDESISALQEHSIIVYYNPNY